MKIQSVLATKGSEVITVRPDQTVREAITLMIEHDIGALVALDAAGRPVGIITERTIIRQSAKTEAVFAQHVEEIMSRSLVTGLLQDDVASVANTMTERRIRYLPIVDRGNLVGIVSIGDVVKAQRDQLLGEVDTLQTQISE